MTKFLDITGERYHRLVGIQRVESRKGQTYWLFQCDCGTQTTACLGAVRAGEIKSCGCQRGITNRAIRTTHGMRHSAPYVIWCSMKARCLNPKNTRFADYGGRGIEICDRWMKFENFWGDMGPTWTEGLTIERSDVNGNYEPRNCHWATWSEQNSNKRSFARVSFRGQLYTIKALADAVGVNADNFRYRLKSGRSVEEAIALCRSGKWRR